MAKLQSFQLAGLQGHTYTLPAEPIEPASSEPTPIPSPTTPEDAAVLALANIDRKAGEVRLRYITSAPGQTEIYLEKTEEAIDYTVAGYPADASSYPFIVAEANASGITCREAAEMIIKKKSLWLGKAAKIEEIRRRGKITIRLLKSIEDILVTEQATLLELDTI